MVLSSGQPRDLFFYGTLMDADVRRLVLGASAERLRLEPARLHGYRRMAKDRSTAPLLVPGPGMWVEGLLARGLDRTQVARLCHFEGRNYRLAPCALRLDGRQHAAAFVFLGAARLPRARRAWRLAPWQRRHKRAFLRLMGLWMAAYREAAYLARGRTAGIKRWAMRE